MKDLDWITLRRTDLVQVLHEAVRDHAEIRLATTVAHCTQDPGGVDITLLDGSQLRADLLGRVTVCARHCAPRCAGADDPPLSTLGYRYAAYDTEDDTGMARDFVSYAAPGHQVEYHVAWRRPQSGLACMAQP